MSEVRSGVNFVGTSTLLGRGLCWDVNFSGTSTLLGRQLSAEGAGRGAAHTGIEAFARRRWELRPFGANLDSKHVYLDSVDACIWTYPLQFFGRAGTSLGRDTSCSVRISVLHTNRTCPVQTFGCARTDLGRDTAGNSGRSVRSSIYIPIHGYLAHKGPPTPLGPPYGPRHMLLQGPWGRRFIMSDKPL